MSTTVLLIPVAVDHPEAAAAATNPSGTGMIIPLYSAPSSAWQSIITDKQVNPSVPMVVVVNPHDGPGSAVSSTYTAWISAFEAAGITVIGYVWTDFGERSMSAIDANIQDYANWYHLEGGFFDGMSKTAADASYYQTVAKYAASYGMTFNVGNPGGSSQILGIFNITIVYEGVGIPTSVSEPGNAIIVYGASSLSGLAAIESSVSYVYITNQPSTSPYAALPSYLSSEVAMLVQTQTTSTTTTTTASATTATITIVSVNSAGQPFNGMRVVVTSGGSTVASGFTPFSFTGTVGQHYSVTAYNYGSYKFQHWDDGLTSTVRSFQLAQSRTFTEYY
jgi:hypothetical protein